MMHHLRNAFWPRVAVACGAVSFAWFAATTVVPFSRHVETAFSANAQEMPFTMVPTCAPVLPLSVAEWNWLTCQVQAPDDAPLCPSLCLHLIALHGPGTEVTSKASGGRVLLTDILLDDRRGEEFFGAGALQRTRYGVRFVSHSGARHAEAHRDHCLAVLAEQGMPLSRPVLVAGEQLTLRDLLNDSIANFHLRQVELSWTAEAYALYLPPQRRWTNRFGERFSFDDLARELLARPFNEASCFGMHLIRSLTTIHRVDASAAILSADARAAVTRRLSGLSLACAASQTADGGWPLDWHGAGPMRRHGLTVAETASNRLLMTAHVAEWLLILPASMRAPPELRRRAARWLLGRLATADGQAQLNDFCAYSHAAHALRRLGYYRSGSTNNGRGPPRTNPPREGHVD